MKTILDAIAGELAVLYLRIKCLEGIEELIVPAYGLPGQKAELQRLGSTPPTRSKQRNKNHSPKTASSEEVRDHVIKHGPLSRRDLVNAFGGNPTSVGRRLKSLLEDGEIGADGPSGARRYRAPETFDIESTLSTIRRVTHTVLPERGVYPVYDVILDLNGASNEQLQKQTGLAKHIVVKECRGLVRLGLIWCTQAGKARVWRPTDLYTGGDAT
jgi:hypothetical protein